MAVAAATSFSSPAGSGPFPPSPLGLGLSQSSDGVRVVRFSCVTYSGSGDFTFP